MALLSLINNNNLAPLKFFYYCS